jgi:hypothetical protein
VLEEQQKLLLGLWPRLAELPPRAVGGHHVPAGTAGGERVRRDHLDAGLQQVVPAADVLRVAVTDGEDDDRVGDDAAVGLPVPLRIDEARLDELVDVRRQRQRDDVSLQACLDSAGLVARSAVRLGERDVVALRRRLEHRDQLRVGLPRRGVGDQGQVGARAGRACRRGRDEPNQNGKSKNDPTHLIPLSLDLFY